MALSEEERRLLEQLEASLLADDPRLVRTMKETQPVQIHRRSATLAGVGFFAGIVLLVLGIQWTPIISIIGFVLMLASTVLAINSWRHVAENATDNFAGASRSEKQNIAGSRQFMEKLEERWRKRHQGDL